MTKVSALGKRMLELRKGKKMTQGEVADLVGVSTVSISKFEKGITRPSLETISKLSTVLGDELKRYLPRIGKFPVLGAENNVEVPIILGNQYNRLQWDYLRRNENDLPSEEDEKAFAASKSAYAFESLSLPKSLLKEGTHIAFPMPGNMMEPTFGQGDLLLLTHMPNVDWTTFPAASRYYEDMDTFPMCVVEVWSATEGVIEFARCAVDQEKQTLVCYYDNRNHYPKSHPLANVKAIWAFTWNLSNRALNPAQQLVYQVAQLQHELRQAKSSVAELTQALAQAQEEAAGLRAQLQPQGPAESPQPALTPDSGSRKRSKN
jgi:transcriptional regulator with XRE-family HTH domain